MNCRLRTNDSFRARCRAQPSPFEALDIDMVTQFPIDYMHAVCHGVMWRMMTLWLLAKSWRLDADSIDQLDRLLQVNQHSWPREFNWHCRSIQMIRCWKATEFRHFLLYAGPALLMNVLEPKFSGLLHRNISPLSSAVPE